MRDRLIELFKKINYNPVKGGIKANLANQFSEYALNQIIDELLANGVIVPPVKVGQTVYRAYIKDIGEEEVLEVGIDDEGVFFETTEARYYEWHFNKCVYFAREEAERALKGADNEKV